VWKSYGKWLDQHGKIKENIISEIGTLRESREKNNFVTTETFSDS
jgi:hypothetical protein